MSGVVGLPQLGQTATSREPQFAQNFWSAVAGAPQLEQFKQPPHTLDRGPD
jgi:hypothetical protein